MCWTRCMNVTFLAPRGSPGKTEFDGDLGFLNLHGPASVPPIYLVPALSRRSSCG